MSNENQYLMVTVEVGKNRTEKYLYEINSPEDLERVNESLLGFIQLGRKVINREYVDCKTFYREMFDKCIRSYRMFNSMAEESVSLIEFFIHVNSMATVAETCEILVDEVKKYNIDVKIPPEIEKIMNAEKI